MKCPNCKHDFHHKHAVVVDHGGVPMSLLELSKLTGIAYSTLQNRYRRGNRGDQLTRTVDEKYSPHRQTAA